MEKSIKKPNKSSLNIPKLLLIGALSGFVSGFFGAGGGVVLIISASVLCRNDIKEIFAETAIITALYSVSSAIIYYLKGNLSLGSSLHLIVPSIVGGMLGAFILKRIKLRALSVIFGVITIIGGAIMLFR